MKNLHHANSRNKEAGVTITTSYKRNFKINNVTRDKILVNHKNE